VIVPVHGAAAELDRCLASLRRWTALDHDRVIVVPDGPQDGAVTEVLERHLTEIGAEIGAEGLLIRPNPERGGFVVAVGRGLAVDASRDAVLLNSDTEVTRGWLDKLARAAAAAPRIATVTPLSNHATICSVPRAPVENTLPEGFDVDGFGDLVERVSVRLYPRLPTGVGFCLLVRRAALVEVGGFDAARFGLGYGEEVDFCLRARRLGWEHVADDATFIYHAGHRSFGDARFARIAAGHRAIRRRFPGYLREIDRFLREDPLAPVRERILEALGAVGEAPRGRPSSPGPRSVVHLVHGYPPWDFGGTELYAHGLVAAQAEHRAVAVYARGSRPDRATGEAIESMDQGVRVRRTVNNFVQRDPFSRNGLYDRRMAADFGRFLDEERPELVHIHHLAGHAANLPAEAHRRGIPILFQLQDWWPLCARVNLTRADASPCPGPRPDRCSACRPLTAAPGRTLWNPLLHRLRRQRFARALALADGFVVGSRFLEESYREHGLLGPESPVWRRTYGVDTGPLRPLADRPPARWPVRFGFVGALMPHKGPRLLIEAFRGLDPAQAELILWGDPRADPDHAEALRRAASGLPVTFGGRFEEGDRSRVFAGLDVLVIPSVGLESFGLVAREAFAAGVPVVAVARGALPEIFEGAPGAGRLVAPDDPVALGAALAELASDPARIDACRRALPPVVDREDHAREIEEIYRRILAGRRRP
jgi:glycosyltransferase involved in cell wall biosynthesis